MINENDYIELLKNCAKGNERINLHRKTGGASLFDPQTRTIQKKTFRRDVTHRFESTDPLQVSLEGVVYQAKRWKRNPNPSTDDIEHKYFLHCNPAIHEAYNRVSGITDNGASATGTVSNENSNDAISAVATPDNRRAARSAAVVQAADYDDFDDFPLDDVEEDGSDEDDWGSKKKRGSSRKNGGKSSSRRSAVSSFQQRQNYAATPPPANVGAAEAKPFSCQLCPAKYKSRPGLNYHKQHVHGESSTPPGGSSVDSTRSSAGAIANC
ncbi:hypothetical protein L596_019222 [Steinernema carpocapsae]|nr:hypothetical protein L596_019222 [Steinernema carpocapsae]